MKRIQNCFHLFIKIHLLMSFNQHTFDPNCQGISFTYVINGDKAREFFDESFANSDEREKYIDTHFEGNTELFNKIKRDISRLEYDSESDEYTSQEVYFRTNLCPDIWKAVVLNETVQVDILSNLTFTNISQIVPWTDIEGEMGTQYYDSSYPILPNTIYSTLLSASFE